MIKAILIPGLLLLTGIATALYAQNPEAQTWNQVDENGLKTGPWKVEYPNGRTRYEATFRAGKPVGEMLRYGEKGRLHARMQFDESGERSYTTMYHKNRKPAAEGWFINREKDSVWTYYSEFDGSVRLREPYEEGLLQGQAVHYFQSGGRSEELSWQKGEKHGPWRQYYPDGSLRLEAAYARDLLEGMYSVYYADSTLKVQGLYRQNLAQGEWTYFKDSGDELYTITFDKGRATDQAKYLELMKDSLMRFETLPLQQEQYE